MNGTWFSFATQEKEGFSPCKEGASVKWKMLVNSPGMNHAKKPLSPHDRKQRMQLVPNAGKNMGTLNM
jgi:hypothetical protein